MCLTESPIQVLEKHLFPTLRTVCPERAEQLYRLIDEHGLTFHFDRTTTARIFFLNPTEKSINVGIRGLERLWATAHACYCFCDELRSARLEDRTIHHLDIQGNQRLEQAAELLSWSLEIEIRLHEEGDQIDPSLLEWPPHLPKPYANPEKGCDEDLTDTLFLYALGYLLHHELAHLRLGHTRGDRQPSKERELSADREAASWLLNDWDQNSSPFTERMLGVAVVHVWTVIAEAHTKQPDASHPPGVLRLMDILDRRLDNANHDIWAFAAVVIEMNLRAIRPDYPDYNGPNSLRNYVEYLCEEISKGKQSE